MPNTVAYTALFAAFKDSIADGSFAKLTFAKTIGNTLLLNIYVRTQVVQDQLLLAVRLRYQQEEELVTCTIDQAFDLLVPYINNPFLSVILFTTQADTVLKLNKKRVATITQKEPTFKNADPILLDFKNNSL